MSLATRWNQRRSRAQPGHGNRVWALRHKVPPGMTTVLIEDYALLRVAIQHVLERVRNAEDILAISPAHLVNMPGSINRPVELLVIGCSGVAEPDIGLLSQAMALFMPRLVLALYSVLDQSVMAACAAREWPAICPRLPAPTRWPPRSAWCWREASAIRNPPRARWRPRMRRCRNCAS